MSEEQKNRTEEICKVMEQMDERAREVALAFANGMTAGAKLAADNG